MTHPGAHLTHVDSGLAINSEVRPLQSVLEHVSLPELSSPMRHGFTCHPPSATQTTLGFCFLCSFNI